MKTIPIKFIYIFFLIFSTQIFAANSCSDDYGYTTINYDFANGNSYSDTQAIAGWAYGSTSYKLYYFKVPSNGTITISLSSNPNDKAYFHHHASDCPAYNYGDTTSTFSVNANDDFNLIVNNDQTWSDTTYTLTVTFTPDSGGGGDEGGGFVSTCPTGTNNGYREFCLRQKITAPGNMVTIGNTILVAPGKEIYGGIDRWGNPYNTNNVSNCNGYTNGTYVADATSTNDKYFLCKYYDDPPRPSTSATVSSGSPTSHIPDPAHSELLWAGLYWQALVSNTSDITNMTIHIKNGKDGYEDVRPNKLDYKSNGYSGYSYSAFSDVTEILKNNGWLTGKFTVADIPVAEGSGYGGLGTYGAWTLVLVYENQDEHLRSFSIFDGWQRITSSNSVDIPVSGFYTPKQGEISSVSSIFVAEGDKNIKGDRLEATSQAGVTKPLTNDDVTGDKQAVWSKIFPEFSRTPDPSNNQGIDIQAFQLGDSEKVPQLSPYKLLEHKDSKMSFKFSSTGDVYWPSMITFNTELYEPDICYDYSYEQLGHYFTEPNDGTHPPRVRGKIFPDANITVGIYFRNNEDSDVKATNTKLNVKNIGIDDTIKYIENSTEVTEAGEHDRVPRTPQTQTEHSFTGLGLGDLPGKSFAYAYYKIDPGSNTEINISIDANVSYTLELIDSSGNPVNIDYTSILGSRKVPLCRGFNGGTGYEPVRNVFNVETPSLYADQKYNLYTQVAGRPWESYIVSYTKSSDADIFYNKRENAAQWIKVDLIDAGAYHDVQAACTERDANITQAVALFYTSDDTVYGDKISHKSFNDVLDAKGIDKAKYYNVAVENAAYRIWHLVDPATGEDLNTTCVGNSNVSDFFSNHADWLTNIGCADACDESNIPSCTEKDDSTTLNNFESCLECIYPYTSVPTCSRDNFSIRPESFVTELLDDNRTDISPVTIATSRNDTSGSKQLKLAAGYPYRFDINATSHLSDDAVRGYTKIFGPFNLSDARAYMGWTPHVITEAQATANCNAPVDQNMSFYLFNGTNYNPAVSWQHPEHQSLENVGEYTYLIEDSSWTRVDHVDYYLSHHTGLYFNTTYDCTNDGKAEPEDVKIGCIIKSDHIRYNEDDTTTRYYPLDIRAYPYDINISGIADTQPTKSFFYMNNVADNGYQTPGYPVDETYAINLRGIIRPEGKDHSSLSNFVQGCYAEDVNFSYVPSVTSVTGINGTTYSLRWRETNSTKTPTDSTGLDDNSTTVPLSVSSPSYAFTKEQGGVTVLDLHINFDRNISEPVNPVDLNISAISADCNPSANCRTNADGVSNHTAVDTNNSFDSRHDMFYAKVQPSLYLYDNITGNSAVTPVSVNIYCDLGDTLCGLYTELKQINSPLWYRSKIHSDEDGNLTLVPQDGVTTTSPSNPISLIGGINNSITVTLTNGTTRPHTSNIDLNGTNIWLIHNPNANEEPSPFYKVRFIGTSKWAGEGETGHVVNDNADTHKNKRVGW